jgi:hypothetical protein
MTASAHGRASNADVMVFIDAREADPRYLLDEASERRSVRWGSGTGTDHE